MPNILFITWFCIVAVHGGGILYPWDTETRDVKSLNGVWEFRLENTPGEGIENKWYAEKMSLGGATIGMPVPSSYNDVTVDARIRDHVGVVWYDRTFYVPKSWHGMRVWLHFISVTYLAKVWVNGQYVTAHEFGFLPFQVEVTSVVNYGQENLITVSVNNTLTDETIPTGSVEEIETSNGTILRQQYPFRHFYYAGIDAPVFIYSTPTLYVDDITLITDIDGSKGAVSFTVTSGGLPSFNGIIVTIRILDATGSCVAESVDSTEGSVFSGTIDVPNAKLWWPFFLSPTHGYLYTFQVTVSTNLDGVEIQDTYRLQFGIRTVSFTNTDLLINDKPIYLRGTGGIEDADIRGKGIDDVLTSRDGNLGRWMGANAFRSAYNPAPLGILDEGDKGGIIISESPFMTRFFNPDLLEKHKQFLTELIQRDKNRPCVVMWSIANQPPAGDQDGSYYSSIVSHVKSLDSTRPVTATLTQLNLYNGNVAEHLDIVGVSMYYGWYTNPGVLDAVQPAVFNELRAWLQKVDKPVLMMEYGADAMPGIHTYPEFPWSEEYQISFLSQYFEVFDKLRNQSAAFIGELIWAYTDFKTQASASGQVDGDKKGIFTRGRQPKCSGRLVRKRYFHLAHQIDGQPLPPALDVYVAPGV